MDLQPLSSTPIGQQTISLDTTKPPDLINLDFGMMPKLVSPEIADTRAFKAQYSPLSQNFDQIKSSIMAGNEPVLRQQAAAEADRQRMIQREQAVSEVVKRANRQVSPDEVQQIYAALDAKPEKRTAPYSVFEEFYSVEWLNALTDYAKNNPDSDLAIAQQNAPDAVKRYAGVGNDIGTKIQAIITRMEDRAQAIEKQNPGQKVWDYLKGWLPGYSQYNLRGNVEGSGFFAGVFQGENFDVQSQKLLALPASEMIPELDRILTNLESGIAGGNRYLAIEFLKNMLGQSQNERIINNILGTVDAATLPFVPSIAKGTINAVRGTRNAVVDMVRSMAKNPDGTLAAASQAAGDIGASAVRTVTSDLTAAVQGKPRPDAAALDGLPSFINVAKENFLKNTGRATQELVDRIYNRITANSDRVMAEIERMVKVEGIPGVLAEQKAIQALKVEQRSHFPGPSNAVYDISDPYYRGISLFTDIHIKDTNGEFFRSEQHARNFASIVGLPQAEVRAVPGPIKPPAKPRYTADELEGLGLPPAKPTIERQGLGYYLTYPMPVRHTGATVWDHILETAYAKVPDGLTGWLNGKIPAKLGKYRTPDEYMSRYEQANRAAVAYGPGKLTKLAEEIGQHIDNLSKGMLKTDMLTGENISRFSNARLAANATGKRADRWKQFLRMVEAEKGMTDDFGNPGRNFQNIGEIQDFYLRQFGRRADDVELEAYFALKDLNRMDKVFREVNLHWVKSRAGVEQHTISFYDPARSTGIDPVTSEAGYNKVTSSYIDGVRHKGVPRGMLGGPSNDNNTIRIDGTGNVKMFENGKMSPRDIKQLKKNLADGAEQIVEVWDVNGRPLSDFPGVGSNRVRYVISKYVDTKPIEMFDQLPDRGGGHFDTEYPFYGKQAIVKKDGAKHSYEGDKTFIALMSRAQGEGLFEKLNEVVRAMAAKDMAGAKALFDKVPFTMEWNEFKNKFYPQKNPVTGLVEEPLLSLKEPFQVVAANQKIIELGKHALENRFNYQKADGTIGNSLKDNTKSGSLKAQHEVQYTSERDAHEMQFMKDEGTVGNPIYKLAPVQYVDPIVSMERGLSKIIHSTFLEPYKDYAIQHWLAEASNWLDPATADIRSSTIYAFQQAKFKKDAPSNIVKSLEVRRAQIQQLLGVQDQVALDFRKAGQELQDSVYKKRGPGNWAEKKEILGWTVDIPERLAALSDPFKFLRGMTYHLTFSYSLPAFLTQSMTWLNVTAISPRSAPASSFASTMAWWARYKGDPATLAAMDNWVSKLQMPGMRSFKPGEFVDAMNLMKHYGFDVVQGEHALVDRLNMPILHHTPAGKIGNAKDAVLEAGQIPFRAGERNARFSAWFSAYLEYREANPTGRVTNQELLMMGKRADDMYGNMSRASSSALHTGPLSLPAQFFAYQIRTSELMMGHRLSGTERARMFAMNALMYGVPGATGLYLVPWGDFWRENQVGGGITNRAFGLEKNQGYVPGANFIQTLFNEGVPAMLGAYATGQGNTTSDKLKSGLYYNIQQKWQTKGLDAIREAFRDDASLWRLLGGAAGSKIADIWAGKDGYLNFGLSVIRDDVAKYNITYDDVVRVARSWAAFNTTERGIIAMRTGDWISKKGLALEKEIGWKNALFMTITGLQPLEVQDAYSMTQTKKAQDHLWDKAVQEFVANVQRTARAERDGNPEQALEYTKNAHIILKLSGVPENKLTGILTRAAKSDSLVKSAPWSFLADPKNLPIGEVQGKTKQFQQLLEREKLRRQGN